MIKLRKATTHVTSTEGAMILTTAKFPLVVLERQDDPHKQKWFLWRSRNDDRMTEDLLGCGATPGECWRDAAERILRGDYE